MPVLGLYQNYGGSGEICGSKKDSIFSYASKNNDKITPKI